LHLAADTTALATLTGLPLLHEAWASAVASLAPAGGVENAGAVTLVALAGFTEAPLVTVRNTVALVAT
jgi:hypothetical protein